MGAALKLGRFELIRQLAVGRQSELHLARTTGIEGLEKLVVVKRLRDASPASFLDEARLAATLHHPNVVQVYDIGVEAGEHYVAMEYVHGEDLERISKAADEQGVPISLEVVLTLVAGVCAGLHYAHERCGADGKSLQIVHRDVSLGNVLVSYDGAVKVVDFGIPGALIGEGAYLSPEQCSGKAIDRRSDLFAVGALLYELTTGQRPFANEASPRLKIATTDVAAPSTIVPGYPPELEAIVLRAMARDPGRRFATARELQAAIEDYAHETRLRVSTLVLARLMSTLFPTRLEEWAHAQGQGHSFLEEHVVQTLIEDGRTPISEDTAARAAISAGARSDEDTTSLNHLHADTGTNTNTAVDTAHDPDTSVGPPIDVSGLLAAPITSGEIGGDDSSSRIAPPPPAPVATRHVDSSPVAAPPRASSPSIPTRSSSPSIPTRASSPSIPTRASSPSIPRAVAPVAERTERVRVPLPHDRPVLVRPPAPKSRRLPLVIAGLVLVAAAVGAFFVFGDSTRSTAAPATSRVAPATPPPPADPAPAQTAPDSTPAATEMKLPDDKKTRPPPPARGRKH